MSDLVIVIENASQMRCDYLADLFAEALSAVPKSAYQGGGKVQIDVTRKNVLAVFLHHTDFNDVDNENVLKQYLIGTPTLPVEEIPVFRYTGGTPFQDDTWVKVGISQSKPCLGDDVELNRICQIVRPRVEPYRNPASAQTQELKTAFRLLAQVWLVATNKEGDYDKDGKLKRLHGKSWQWTQRCWCPVAEDGDGRVLHDKLKNAHPADGEPDWSSIDLEKLDPDALLKWAFPEIPSNPR